jgi:putative ABC transport system permease protein
VDSNVLAAKAQDSGWNPQNVLTFEIILPSEKYPNPVPAFQELQRRFLSIPGVIAASAGMQLPDRGSPVLNDVAPFFEIEGQPIRSDKRRRTTIVVIEPGYFRALGVPLLRGRDFEERDMTGKAQVAIINESLAKAYFHDADPSGKHIRLDSWTLSGPRVQEIIGVAHDIAHDGVENAQPIVYLPLPDVRIWGSYFVVKTAADPLGFVNVLQSAVHSFDPNEPVDDIQTLNQRLSASIARERFIALLVAVFSALGLILAAVGLFGVVSYVVAQRNHEIGIRLAIGAGADSILKLVLGEGMGITSLGIMIGLAGALAQTRLIQAQLFGVSATDSFTLVAVTLFLLLVASLACLIPAWRAAKTDPVTVLRE